MSLKELFQPLIVDEKTQKAVARQIPINEKTFSAHLTGFCQPNRKNASLYIAFLKRKGIRATFNEIYE